MATFAQVRAAVASALDGITGLRSTAYLSDSASPPPGGGWAMVEFDDIDYDLSFGGATDELPLLVIVFAPREAEKASQVFIDTLRDPNAPTGIKPVLEADAGVAALVAYLRVRRVLRPTITTIGNVDYITVEFQCEVVA